jgi:DNA-binding NarL/FixJ family response regulator
MIRLALVDDQQLVREGIAGLLALSGKNSIIWQATNGADALEKIQTTPVDLLLADIRMPEMSGITMVEKIRALGINTPVLMLTTFDDNELLNASISAGANGFLLKDVSLEQLIHSIELVVSGEFLVDPQLLKSIKKEPQEKAHNIRLSKREIQILRLISGGFSNKEISNTVFLAEGTVRNHISNILIKLDCRDRTQAALKAIQLQLF